MGITGLLPFLKKIQRDVHVSAFRGQKVAVDAYCWLHKGAYTCAMQLVMKSERLDKLPFIKYCMKRVNLLRQYDITPVMVFDGGHLPSKLRTEQERRERRRSYEEKGKAFLKDGKRSEAVDCFQKCVDVSPEMALAFIKECRSVGAECIVAPYEADAQLAYLQKEGIVDLVITEDSDLLVFGCKQVLFKLDDAGNGKLIQLQELGKANSSLIGFSEESFRQMCILSGCDYLPSIPGIGLATASKLMRKYNLNPHRLIRSMRSETSKVPKDYEDEFRKAEHTFLYQLVFDPRTQAQVHLNQLPQDVDTSDLPFCGAVASPRKAVGIARGNVNPITYEVMGDYSPSKALPPKSTSWEASAMGSANRQYHVAVQARLSLSSSRDSRQPFRPPKRSRLTEVEDASLGDKELQSIYSEKHQVQGEGVEEGEGEREEAQQTTVVVSRFFAKHSRSEGTPSDWAPPTARTVMRKLDLGALDEGGGRSVDNAEGVTMEADDGGESVRREESQEDDNPESERVKGPQAQSLSSLPNDPVIATIPETPAESPPRSRARDPDRNLRRKRLLEEFGYSKRRKTEAVTTVAMGDLGVGSSGKEPLLVPRNPFSKASPTKLPSSTNTEHSQSPAMRTCLVGLEHQTPSCSWVDTGHSEPLSHDTQQTISQSTDSAHMEMGSSSEHSLDTYTQVLSEEDSYQRASLAAEPSTSRSFMTSDDFLTSALSYAGTGCVSSVSGSVSSTVEMYSESLGGTTSHVATNSQPVNMDVVDLTHETMEQCPNYEPGRTPQPCSKLLSALTARRAVSESTRRRKGPSAGLPRRKSSSAGFNPPRPVEQSNLKQMFLGQYSFHRRPRMS